MAFTQQSTMTTTIPTFVPETVFTAAADIAFTSDLGPPMGANTTHAADVPTSIGYAWWALASNVAPNTVRHVKAYQAGGVFGLAASIVLCAANMAASPQSLR